MRTASGIRYNVLTPTTGDKALLEESSMLQQLLGKEVKVSKL
jgi:hypothetical protein